MVLAAAAQTGTPAKSPPPPSSNGGALTTLSTEQHVLRAGDQIELHISSLPELETVYAVRVDGSFFHPIVGEIKAEGRTLGDLRAQITKVLAKELKNPKFRLGIREVARNQVAVLGEAKAQGTYEVGVGASVLDVIAKSGGLTEKADRHRAMLLRGDQTLDISLEPEAGAGLTKVQSGDVLYILAGSPISVTGEVTEPGVYNVSRVVGSPREALLAAGGAKEEASLTRVRLIRATLPQPVVMDLSPGAELPLEARQLQAGDIIVVPARQVVVLGAVKEPGPVSLKGSETLMDVLPKQVIAESDIQNILVIRAENVRLNRDEKEEYNLKEYFEEGKADIVVPIRDGDLVYVPAKGKEGGLLQNMSNIFSILGLARLLF
jgi:protein involved in polysaccharide export with SLBB domain